MTNPKPGDRVKVIADKEYEGVLMPNEETDSVVVKLDNGYNVGIEKGKVREIKLVKKHEEKASKKEKHVHKKGLKTISILHTGGTIASKVDYEAGGVVASFTAEDLIAKFPEIEQTANIRSVLVSNMMSEDMTFSDHKKIAEAIKKEIKEGTDGVIVGHGTDTLAVTSASLAFMFEKINIPILLVGAQRSSDRGSTDAALNLICAARFIAKTDFAGVALCMHDSSDDNKCAILPATKTRKLHTSRRDAFRAINDTPIATVDFNTKKIEFIKEDYPKKSKEPFVMKDKLEEKVAVIRTYVSMKPDMIEALTKKGYKGLVLEATGIGQAPTNTEPNLPNYEALKKFITNDGVVVLTSQCLFGRVHKDIYKNCRRLAEIGVIFGEDMLTDTAYVKLAWLLANFSREEAKELVTKNLRGEINERTSVEEFLKD
ncbi:Glu-tRNA(Gln) amidotransferase subunit GatD [Candidatus Woesearchaeota archaeon]|nr:Glu-tRNA(Gln) amidotransferase subunit GatD [Candidatus Woesearchaeota archaeon]